MIIIVATLSKKIGDNLFGEAIISDKADLAKLVDFLAVEKPNDDYVITKYYIELTGDSGSPQAGKMEAVEWTKEGEIPYTRPVSFLVFGAALEYYREELRLN